MPETVIILIYLMHLVTVLQTRPNIVHDVHNLVTDLLVRSLGVEIAELQEQMKPKS
jgi:hypothetical protein